MSLELGSRFRLPDGRLVEVVPDAEKILGLTTKHVCMRCCGEGLTGVQCATLGCIIDDGEGISMALSAGYPRILKEVENE